MQRNLRAALCVIILKLEKASTPSPECRPTPAMFFVTHDFDLPDPKINGFPGLILEHVCIKFGDPRCIVRKKQTYADKQR